MTSKQFATGWRHFCRCIDFNHSSLDAEAIRFMTEMPGEVSRALVTALTKKKSTKRGSKK